MTTLGFTQNTEDENIFTSGYGLKDVIILAIYVDDILVLTQDTAKIDTLLRKLSTFFKVRTLGTVKKFLSLDINWTTPTTSTSTTQRSVHISQANYVRKVLKRFNMDGCNPAKTPSIENIKLQLRSEQEKQATKEWNKKITGHG